MTSSSPAARAKRSRSPPRAREVAGPGARRDRACDRPARDGRGRRRSSRSTRDGLIDEAALDAVLAEGPALVAIQQVNNETGVIQPLDRIARAIREAGSLLLADCAQSAGKLPLPDADFIAACGAQARRPAGHRRAAGPGPGHARAGRRAGEGLSPRHAGCAAARWLSPRRWPPRPYDMRAAGGAAAAARARRSRPLAAWSSPKTARASRRSAPYAHARRVERLAARPVRPRRDRGLGRKRLLVGQHEGERACSRRWASRRKSPAASSGSASGPRRARPTSTASSPNGGGSPSAPRRRRHDLPRLSGDDAGRARSRRGDAAVDRGEVRQSALAVALGPRSGGGDRGRARARSNGRSASTAAASPSPAARPRRSTGRSRARSRRRARAATGSSPSRPSMPRCSTPANGWRGRASTSPSCRSGRTACSTSPTLERELDERVLLVAVMLVNNEIGVIQPIAEIAAHGARGAAR